MPFDPQEPRFTRPGFSGQDVPFYGLIFDKKGKCTSTETREAVLDVIRDDGYTDVIFYSHGWNNDWDDAVGLYIRTLDGVGEMARIHASLLPDGIKPVFIGVGWPSAALLWPWEQTPDIAAVGDDQIDDLAILTDDMNPEQARALRDFVEANEKIETEDVARLAGLLDPAFREDVGNEVGEEGQLGAEELEKMFRKAPLVAENVTDAGADGGFDMGSPVANDIEDVQAAGLLSGVFGVRKLIRLATVYKMKDRAGIVGLNGVCETLKRLLDETGARIHIVGHSYGCKVMMTAISQGLVSRKVQSVALLQPAVNCLAMSSDVLGQPGGFRVAIGRVEKPLLITHSSDDFPLTKVFPLAVRRKKDLGEIRVAGSISQWSAMGGVGARNLEDGEKVEIDLPAPGEAYPASGSHRVIDLNGSGKITSHSDVANDFTSWAILQNLR